MKKINLILKKCKTLSGQLGRTSSYSSLRSKSARNHHHHLHLDTWGSAAAAQVMYHNYDGDDGEKWETILVGSTRRRFLVKSKYLDHPLLKAMIERSQKKRPAGEEEEYLSVKCEVVLFHHLLWMLENADPHLPSDNLSLEELADLYLF